MKRILIIIIIIFLLCGCKEEKRNCIESHKENYTYFTTMCIPSGKSIICYPVVHSGIRDVCDEYEEIDKLEAK